MKNVLRTAILALALLAIGVVSQPSWAAEQVAVATSGSPTGLDPHKTFNGHSFIITSQVFETLVTMGEDGIQPKLATHWEMVSPTTWRIDLREGVTFHNGDRFDAQAAKFSIERLIDPDTAAQGAFVLSVIDHVNVVDDFTIDVVTEYPFAPLMAHFSHPVTAIVPPAAAEMGDELARHPVGTGPFRFQSAVSGDQVLLSANSDYWAGAPEIDTVLFRTIPEVSTQVVELQTGAVDLMFDLPPNRIETMEQDPNFTVAKRLGWGSVYLGFNDAQGPLSDVRVRRAVAHAIDREAIVTQLRQGMALKADAPIPSTVWGAAEGLEPYEYDPAKAESLLREAGYPNGLHLDLLAFESEELSMLSQAIQYSLSQVGIDVDLHIMEYGAFAGEVQQKDHDLWMTTWGTVTLDADYALYALFHSSEIPVNNNSFYANSDVDRLLNEGRTNADPVERQAAYQKAQEIIHADLPVLTLYYPLSSYAKSNRLQGEQVPYSFINLDLSNASIE